MEPLPDPVKGRNTRSQVLMEFETATQSNTEDEKLAIDAALARHWGLILYRAYFRELNLIFLEPWKL